MDLCRLNLKLFSGNSIFTGASSVQGSLPFPEDTRANAPLSGRLIEDDLHKSLLKTATLQNVKHAFSIPKSVKVVLVPGADQGGVSGIGAKVETKSKNMSHAQSEHQVHSLEDSQNNNDNNSAQKGRSGKIGALYAHEFDETASFSSSLPGSLPPGLHASRPRTAPSERKVQRLASMARHSTASMSKSRSKLGSAGNNAVRDTKATETVYSGNRANFCHEKRGYLSLTRDKGSLSSRFHGMELTGLDSQSFITQYVKKRGVNFSVAKNSFVDSKVPRPKSAGFF